MLITLSPGARDLPVDQLGLAILNDLLATNEWNEYNYLLAAERAEQERMWALFAGSYAVLGNPTGHREAMSPKQLMLFRQRRF